MFYCGIGWWEALRSASCFPRFTAICKYEAFRGRMCQSKVVFWILLRLSEVGGQTTVYTIFDSGSKEYFGEAALRALPDAFLDDAQAIAEPAQPVKRGSSAWCFGGASPSTWAQAINLRKIDQIQSGLNQSHSLRWYGMRWHEYVWVYKQ